MSIIYYREKGRQFNSHVILAKNGLCKYICKLSSVWVSTLDENTYTWACTTHKSMIVILFRWIKIKNAFTGKTFVLCKFI